MAYSFDLDETNVAFRDAARELSGIRDSQVMVETFDALVAATPRGVTLPDLRTVREELMRCHVEATTTSPKTGIPSTGPATRARTA